MAQQIGSVVTAVVLSSGLLLALLHGTGQPAAGSGRMPRAPETVAQALVAGADPPVGRAAASAEPASARLLVMDVSDPAHATVVGHSGSFANVVRGLALDAPYLYLMGPTGDLRVLDVSDPTHPIDSSVWSPELTTRALVANRGQVYVADYEYYADHVAVQEQASRVFDRAALAPATAPTVSQKGIAMAASGDYVYVAASMSGLHIVDVHDPTQPVAVGSYLAPDSVLDVSVEGRYAYLATYTQGLRIVDVADLARPVEVGAYPAPGITTNVAVSGRYAYMTDHFSGVHVVDVSDPAAPRGVRVLPPSSANSIEVKEGYAYVTDAACGLRVVDVRAPAEAKEIAHYPGLGAATAVAVAGRYAYVAVTRSDSSHPCEGPLPSAQSATTSPAGS